MSEAEIMRGQTTLTFLDHVRGWGRLIAKMTLISAALLAVALFLTWAAYLHDADWLRLREAPLAGLRDFALDAGPFFAGTLAAVDLVILAAIFGAFVKMPQANRTIFYEIDDEAIVTRDAADFALTIPWRSVVAARESKQLLFLTLSSGALRFIPWRAFAPQERARLKALATNLGAG
jgi:hypothetical protein